MRAIFAIPHFYKPRIGSPYGSERVKLKIRLRAVAATIAGLHQTFGRRQALDGTLEPSNRSYASGISVVLCTAGDDHLAGHLPARLFKHKRTNADPRLLGYECHAVLAENLGRFDYYCYAEDDILVTDPLLFLKLAWFCDTFGEQAPLQPHRFEIATDSPIQKLYIDGPLHHTIDRKWSALTAPKKRITSQVLGAEISFERTDNPHAGCFFLNARQMETWASRPYFLDRSTEMISPMVSAANLGLIRTFELYKPALAHAGFFEVRHFDRRYIGDRLEKMRRQETVLTERL